MKKIHLLFILVAIAGVRTNAQTAEEVVAQVKAKLDRVNDYEAKGKMKTNVIFIKAPIASVRIYFKKPNRLKVKNESGISFIPKGSVNINLGAVFNDATGYEIIDAGKDTRTGLRVIKMLPKDENADIVLSTLYVDDQAMLVNMAKTTTKENGTYELAMTYGKYAEYGLADKIVFTFNTKEYKLPKGVTFDYDDGSDKEAKESAAKSKDRKGRVEIVYSSYSINKGVPDSVFE